MNQEAFSSRFFAHSRSSLELPGLVHRVEAQAGGPLAVESHDDVLFVELDHDLGMDDLGRGFAEARAR